MCPVRGDPRRHSQRNRPLGLADVFVRLHDFAGVRRGIGDIPTWYMDWVVRKTSYDGPPGPSNADYNANRHCVSQSAAIKRGLTQRLSYLQRTFDGPGGP